MNITTRTVLRHFLLKFRVQLDDPKVTQIDPFFQRFFTKPELQDMVYSMYKEPPTKESLDAMSKAELLEAIGDDAMILGYFLDRWSNERATLSSITTQAVLETLEQLGLHTHYLAYKLLSEWDSYDRSNFLALQRKAGRLVKVYGIYDASIKEEEVHTVTSPPERFYESHALAQTALDEMVIERKLSPDDLHILSLYAGS